MKVMRLRVTNLRAIPVAEFRFQSGFNAIAGVNGVGKTSVLDALGVCLAAVTKYINRYKFPLGTFSSEDIRVGAGALEVECDVEIAGTSYTYLIHKPRETNAPRQSKAGMPREQVVDTPETGVFFGEAPRQMKATERRGRPIAVLFSTSRAVPSLRAPGKRAATGGFAAAFADAFADRELRLREFADWMKVQSTLKRDGVATEAVLIALEESVRRFLPGYSNLRVDDEDQTRLLIDRENTTLAVRQLSDGERGALALVLDLTRRLVQANPGMRNPIVESEAVVLIDELELHLHPKWQRQIVHNLTATFPRCQFIVTTHSPQVVGEARHERIQILAGSEVWLPEYSLGVDSSRVLDEIMDAESRTEHVKQLLSKLAQKIDRKEYDQASKLEIQLSKILGPNDPEVIRTKVLLEFLKDDE